MRACFKQNLIDVHNGDHAVEVVSDIKNKIVGRFFERSPVGRCAPADVVRDPTGCGDDVCAPRLLARVV